MKKKRSAGLTGLERACFSSPCQCTPRPGQIDSDGLPVGFHYILCISDLLKKREKEKRYPSLPPAPSHVNTLFPLRERYKLFLKVKKIARGDFFQCIFLISSSDLKSPPPAFFLLSKTPSCTPWGLQWNAASI